MRLEFVSPSGRVDVKKRLHLEQGEILDSMFMSCKALRAFLEESMEDALNTGVMWSMHIVITSYSIHYTKLYDFALLLLENLLGRLFSLGNRTRGWLSRRRLRKARHQTLDGLVALAEGHYREAERLMIKGARNTETPLINYLTAAEAAQAQGQDEKRDDYLRQAEAEHPKAELAVGLIRARLQLRQGQAAEAEAILSQLREAHPQNLMVQSLLIV